nr:hypothetical protein [Nitrosomonas nitrosa]
MTDHRRPVGAAALRLSLGASSFLLSGCVAAAPAIFMAATALTVGSTAFFGYKMYQSASGSDIEIGFENDLVSQVVQEELFSAETIAFWPSPNRSLVVAAEDINSELEISVISPALTTERLRAAGIATSIETMTAGERAQTFYAAAEALNADFIVTLTMIGTETDSNVFSIRRSTYTANYDVVVYSHSSNAEVWTSRLIAELGIGRNIPSQSEIDEVAGRAVADRIIDFSEGNFIVSYIDGETPEIRLVERRSPSSILLP